MSARRYRFGPLEQRAVVGPLRAGQVAVVAVAGALALVAMYVFRSWIGMGLALFVLAVTATVIYLPVEGRTAEEWAPILSRWLCRGAGAKRGFRSAAPTAGVRMNEGAAARFTSSLPPALCGLQMLEAPY